mmetsp:Transcript_22918/g.34938  ORF Transcript_22918/g.34938 Transcript_22918/m.34938 type:complete len:179 (-) Transcript_22918:319-855(-)|eukprot:CAMPEP_0194083046 /NCGR_PEP_ID=MMETSP0149-20130528/8395_1 /TAXON_ID=122233 /ORGANISM="Chaetoceros debilis, Strain MM31A-1" /LENGTH=178 /DNA_ID=CAMNT_0038765347 /DNA_START=153 /DNA_END=689 /DNA_ORIENTATION=+
MRLAYLLLSVLSFLTSSVTPSDAQLKLQPKDYFDMCAKGNIERLQEYFKHDPTLVKKASEDGETCLHLASISKSLELAQLLVKNGADVNHRVTHDQGLRMTPLSWHAFGGNHEIVKLLLDHGADVNAVFDHAVGSDIKITATDVASNLVAQIGEDGSDDFKKTLQFLLQKGGKKYAEL